MPFIEIERPLGVWTRRHVTHTERRELLQQHDVRQRFVDDTGVVWLAHPDNPICFSDGMPPTKRQIE